MRQTLSFIFIFIFYLSFIITPNTLHAMCADLLSSYPEDDTNAIVDLAYEDYSQDDTNAIVDLAYEDYSQDDIKIIIDLAYDTSVTEVVRDFNIPYPIVLSYIYEHEVRSTVRHGERIGYRLSWTYKEGAIDFAVQARVKPAANQIHVTYNTLMGFIKRKHGSFRGARQARRHIVPTLDPEYEGIES